MSDFLVAKCKLNNTERDCFLGLTTFLAKIRHPGDGVKVCVCTQNSVCLLVFVHLLMGNFTAFEEKKH